MDFARTRGLRVAMQGTGHNAAPMGPLDDTVLVKTSEMRGVEIDERHCIARVEAGAQWLDVTGPASEAGLAPLAGSAPDVGIVGYTLGGGLSWLGRRYGLAANRLLSAEVVTADGKLVRASRRRERRPVLGAARRRRQLRRRRRDRVRADPDARPSTPACSCSRPSAPARSCRPGASGPPRCRTRSPPPAGS